MKKNLLKSILMTVALIFGVTGAWAADGNAVVKMTYVDYDNPTTAIGEIAQGETARSGFNKISNGSVDFGNKGWGENKITYIQVDASAIEGTITGATLTAEVSGSSDSKRKCNYGVGYNASVWSADLTYETADKTITQVGNEYETKTKSASTFESATFDISNAIVGDEDKVVTILMYETAAAGGYIKNPTVTITYLDASQAATYTVKYVCGETEVKEATTGTGAIGSTYTVTEDDKASCMFNDVKYIYVSDDAASQAIAGDGSTVITVTFREAEKYNYTLKSSLGGIIKEGTDWEGNTTNVAYPRYLAQDGTLYSAGKGSAGWYLHTFDMSQNNVEATIDYTATETTGVVFIAEAEDIETLTVSTAAYSDARCSNGLGAYNAGEGDALITNLPNGKYKLYTAVWGGTGVDFAFKAGEAAIGTFACAGSITEYNTEEFELNAASTPITLGATENPARCIDFVYIVKTGDAELAAPTPATGKMDFSKMDLPMSSGNSTAGDITEDKTFTADEFSVTISPKVSGTNNRIWDNKGVPQLRIYSGTLTVKAAAGKTLTKIVFDQSKWGTISANVGTLTAQTWTGEAEEVVFTVTEQCQINSITVGEEPIVDVANIAAFKALTAGTRAKLAVNGAKVTFSKGDYTYIEDETGALLLYQTGLTMTAGKAITGFINGAYKDHNGLAELTAIDVTPASEFTEADTELTATVMTVAEASDVANASKLVKLENVNIDVDLQTIKQGEDEIAFYDKFGVMTDYTYPTVAKSIVGIINTSKGYNTFCPVSPDSVVAGEVVIPEVANIAAAKAEEVRGTEIKLNVTGAKITMNAGPELDGSFIEDATGAIMVDRTITNLIGAEVNSATLTGHIVGTVAKDQKRGGIFVMSASANTATASEVTNEATTLEATPTTIAEINAGQVCDVTSKYVVLSNVKFNYSEYGDSKLIDGEEEIAFYDVQYMIPEATLSMTESFKSIKGVVTYLNYMGGLTFIPYGEYEAVEKELTKVENIAALKNVADGEYIELTLNNAQVTLFDRGMRGSKIVLEDETAGIQIQDQSVYGGEPIFTALGQTFNGSMVLQYMDQDGMATLIATQASVSDKYTSEVKDVVAKDIAFADAKSENYNMKLVKIANIGIVIETVTVGEGEDAYTTDIPYLTDGNTKVQISDFFSKLDEYYNEEGKLVLPEKCNITGYIMPYPLYNDTWTEIIGTTDYFIPTVVEEVAVAEARKWQFDAMGEADEALLAADTEHWSVNKYRYQNTGVAFNNEVIKVNDVELEVTKGLLFTAEAGKLLLGSGVNGSYHFMQVQKGSSFVVTDLAVGDTVRMVVQTAGSNEATVEAPATSVANIIEGFEPTKDKHTCTFVMCEAGSITLKGANSDLRFMSLEVKAGNPNEVANLRKWDFTAWSDETKANLAADAATVVPTDNGDGTFTYPTVTPWRSYEKVDGPTEKDPDREGNAYWYGTAINGSEELVANSVVIAETKGLLFNTMAAGALAIGVNYPETSLGTYEGPSYLWIGGSNNSFTIPNVKSGSKITLGVESHKNTNARGVKLTINGEEIGSAVPTTYQVFDFTVAGELTDNVLSDVVLTNTSGCHIYFITVDATGKTEDAINEVKAVVKTINNDVYTINGVKVRNAGESLDGLAKGLYIIGGKKVVVK